jgi:histone H1/5
MADVAAPAPPKAKKATKPKKAASHPKYSEMITAAVGALKERGGSSRQAILKYIQANFKVQANPAANSHLKLALKAGIKNGTLKQSKGTGASGSFKLGEVKKAAKKATKPKAAKPKKAKTPKKKVAAKKPAAKKTPTKKAAAKKTAKPKKAAKK